ncbi:MAG TPA: DUF5988 family protein [Actinophytocola sp.]|uniref:DUF5988 family protein n=1 Tax=Actinophytocola sp. TaxID=1872138 RepID=UPI002F95F98E
MDRIRVLLVGGPSEITGEGRVREVATLSEAVKVVHGGGREHFRYSGESRELHGAPLPVFRWCDRTKIAE